MIGAIICGGIIGWLASIITGNNAKMGIIANVIVGVIGSYIGSFIASNLGVIEMTFIRQIIFGIIGSVIFLTFLGIFFKKR